MAYVYSQCNASVTPGCHGAGQNRPVILIGMYLTWSSSRKSFVRFRRLSREHPDAVASAGAADGLVDGFMDAGGIGQIRPAGFHHAAICFGTFRTT